MKKRFTESKHSGNIVAAIAVLAIVGVMSYLTPVAQAETIELPATHVVAPVDCMKNYHTGFLIMQYRQDGLPLDTMIELFDGDADKIAVVKKAFTVGEFNLRKNQDKAAKQFAEKEFNECEAAL